MANNMQGYQGYGVNTDDDDVQAELISGLAGLPQTDLAYDWMLNGTPQGRMVGEVFVPPSWTQYVADAAKTGLGGMMLNRRNQKAQQLAEAIADRLRNKDNPQTVSFPGQMPNDDRRPIGSENVSMGAQPKPVDMTVPVPAPPPARSNPFPGMMPTGNRKPIGLEEDIFSVSMPYGGLRY